MLILGIDTSTNNTSVGLVEDGKSVGSLNFSGKSMASERLLDLIGELFTGKYAFEGLDAIAVSIGPGSYTGLRIGLATAKGLALPRNLPVLPVPTFWVLDSVFRRESDEDAILFLKSHQDYVYYSLSRKRLDVTKPEIPIFQDTFTRLLDQFSDISLFVGDIAFPVPEGKRLLIRYPQGEHTAMLGWKHFEELSKKSHPEMEPDYYSNLEVKWWNPTIH